MSEEMGNQTQEIVNEEISTESTEQTTEQMTQEEKQAFLKIKYNKEEIELDEERTRELAQKGMNYDKVQERLKQLESDPRLSFVEQQAQKYNMTTEQYLEAVKKAEEEEKLNELVSKNIPEEIAKEMLENRKFRQEYEKQQRETEQKAKKDADLKLFIETFPNVKPDDIPQSVWAEFEQGKSIVDAYTKHENQILKQKLTELEKTQQLLKQNEENSSASTGSLTGQGETSTDFISFKTFEANKSDQSWVKKNLTKIMESRAKW